MKKGYQSVPLSFNRKMVIASASVTKRKNAIHSFAEVDITESRRIMKEHFEKTGEKLSLTAYIVTCLAQVIGHHKQLNSFIKGRKLILLDDVNISVLVERELEEERFPEPVGIQQAQEKTFRQIQHEIREAVKVQDKRLGGLSKMTWVRFIPGFLLKKFVSIADRNIPLGIKYGKVAVTAVGMFSREPVWFIPHGSPTVGITVGSISKKMVETEGKPESREHLCITASFDHDIVDGAPAARFMSQFIETLKSGKLIRD